MDIGADMDRVISWCEDAKRQRGRTPVIERNPFRDEMPWMRRFTLIEIDRPKESASRHSLVYDSTTRSLWQFLNGTWHRVERELRVER
ncbi:MAG: hypothetical protein PHV13_02375 [Candidatus ainarchaeum sp.]|nr:hypothetical protein [Candidatus ainarchaeum sp.]